LNQVGGLEITQMPDLEDLNGLQGLSIVEGTLAINANPKLKTLFGLQGIVTIGRKLSFVDNPELELAFFDDDDQDREVDVTDATDGINELDFDQTPESGIGAFSVGGQVKVLEEIGDPLDDGQGTVVGGQTGVVELRNNPKLSDEEFLDEVMGGLGFVGLFFLCGNDGTVDANDAELRLVSFAVCADAQDGLIDVVTGGDGGAAGGEGEGE